MTKRLIRDYSEDESENIRVQEFSNSNGSSFDDEHTYIAESIVDKKTVKGTLLYKVKWKDYPLSDSTWEKATQLQSIKILIDEYEKKQEDIIKKSLNKIPSIIIPTLECKLVHVQKAVTNGNIKDNLPKRIIKIYRKKKETLECEIEWCEQDKKRFTNSLVSYNDIEILMPLLITHYFKQGGSITG